MSWLSTLGKIAGIVGAPFTGGASLAAIPMIDGIGRVASGISSQRSQNRFDQNAQQSGYDQSRLAFDSHNLTAPSIRAHNSVQGDILAGVQPVTSAGTSGHHVISGGLSPALLSENSRSLGRDMSRQALLSQMSGPMSPTPMKQASKFDSFLNGIGYAGLAAGTYGAMRPQAPQIPRPQIPQIPMGPIPGIPMDTLPERRWY